MPTRTSCQTVPIEDHTEQGDAPTVMPSDMMTKNISFQTFGTHNAKKSFSPRKRILWYEDSRCADHGRKVGHRTQIHKMCAGAEIKTGKNYAEVITEDKTGILHSLRNWQDDLLQNMKKCQKRTRPDSNRRPIAPQAIALSKLCNESKKFSELWLYLDCYYRDCAKTYMVSSG